VILCQFCSGIFHFLLLIERFLEKVTGKINKIISNNIAVQNKILEVQTETSYGPFGERALQSDL